MSDRGRITSPPNRGRSLLRRAGRGALLVLLVFMVAAAAAALWVRGRMLASLPRLDGRQLVQGLTAPVTIERDTLGVPTIRGENRRDVAFATGFLHAQDRFFQMDLLRRRSAGEFAEIVGAAAYERDAAMRIHRFRSLAERVLAGSSPEVRSILEAYSAGVNTGLRTLDGEPFEYLVLRCEPRPWRPADSVLVLLSMFVQLQGADGGSELTVARMHDLLPEPLFRFLVPEGTEWDAPMLGGLLSSPPIPPPAVDARRLDRAAALPSAPLPLDLFPRTAAASNASALAGWRTASGAGLLADDLHLDLSVPNLWYRTSIAWPEGRAPRQLHRVTGVTLPGAPPIVVGSNGRVAWGFSNSLVDTSDLVVLDPVTGDDLAYRTPTGPRRLERFREMVRIKGAAPRPVDGESSIWGPVLGRDDRGRRLALRWVAHEEGAVDFEALHLETATSVAEALAIAHRSGFPALNFIAVDAAGHLGWTILGRIPGRVGFDGELPGSWADGYRRWDGLLPPDEVPQIVDPPSGQLWAANNRIVDGAMLDKLGHGGFLFAARARQLRDDLAPLRRATPHDLLQVDLDDRAILLSRWHDLMLGVLTPEALAAHPQRRELRELVERWGGRAAVSSAGYRIVRTFRISLARLAFDPLTAAIRRVDPEFDYIQQFDQFEGPLWQLVTVRPSNLLNPRYASWQDELLAAVDETITSLTSDGRPLAAHTWGDRNTTSIRHPLSRALPFVGRWLDMPTLQLPGDQDMPRVQHPSHGATLRLVVSPGHEAEGIFHMPGGESGNPESAHYRDGFAAWAAAAPTPFLPGPPRHLLRLVPPGGAPPEGAR